MFKIKKILVISFSILVLNIAASEVSSVDIEQLEQSLAKVQAKYPGVNSPLYQDAIAKVEACKSVNGNAKKLKLLYPSTEISVKAAISEIMANHAKQKTSKVKDERIKILKEINRIQNEITQIEQGYSSTLQKNLENQKQLTEEQRLQAEEQRLQAEAEKARREELEAEALKRQQEAENRLRGLQSKLINVKKDARGMILSMSDILFAVGKADLTPDLKTSLAKIVGILTVYKESKVIIEGHTDNTGSQKLNDKLSLDRATNVMNFMIKNGLGADRLTAKGLGMKNPVADNGTKEGRQKNRRVDLIIADK